MPDRPARWDEISRELAWEPFPQPRKTMTTADLLYALALRYEAEAARLRAIADKLSTQPTKPEKGKQ